MLRIGETIPKGKFNGAVSRGLFFETPSKNKPLVSQVTYMWLESKKNYVKPSTLSRYRTVVKNHINLFFENTKIYELTDASIQSFLAKLMQTLKPKTVRDILSVLEQILDYSFEQGFRNKPIRKIKTPKCYEDTVKILSPSEQRQLVNFLKAGIDLKKLGVLICIFTGIRLGEICGLRWEDVDFAHNTISIRRTIQRINAENGGTSFLIDTPKTHKSIRDIPVPDFLMCYLRECRCGDLSSYVLTGTTQFTQPRTYQNKLKIYLRESGLPQYFHFHTLRHTFASRAIELGFDMKTLSEILGHTNVNITLNRYVHSSMELKRRNMELFCSI